MTRSRVSLEAELTPEQQEALAAFEEAFGVDWRTTEKLYRVIVEDGIIAALFDHYRAAGYSILDAAKLAGDELGLGPAAVRSRYYRDQAA